MGGGCGGGSQGPCWQFNLTKETHSSMSVIGKGGKGDNSVDTVPVLETLDLFKAVFNNSLVSAKETARNLDSIEDDGRESEEGTVQGRSRSGGGQKQFAFVRVANHADGVSQGVIANEEVMHCDILGMPFIIRRGCEEARHVCHR